MAGNAAATIPSTIRRCAGWRLLLLLAICLAYSNSFQNGFHFDDFHTVVDNPAIRSLRNVPQFFADATTFSVLPANRTYRPIVSTSLAFDYALGHGYVPFWFHLSTFVLFLVLVALIYELTHLLLEKIQPSPVNAWLALLTAAWFGLHPAMAETVNYVIQRGDIDCTLGCVAALFFFARYPHLRRTGIYLLPLALALLSKPPAAVFPVLLFLYVFFFEDQSQRVRHALIAALPALTVTALLLWLQSAMTPKSFAPSIISPWDYRITQPFTWLRYFGALFLPLHLNVDTDLSPFTGFNPQALAGLVFLAALLVAIWWATRRRQLYPIAFGLLWFVVTQLPTSLYPLSEAENDHRMFFSFPGLMLAVVWAAALFYRSFITPPQHVQLRPLLVVLSIVILTGYAWGTYQRNLVWHDEESLWRDDVVKSPHNGRGLMIYGLTQMNKGAYPVALDYFQRALIYTPNYSTLEINLGVVSGAMADAGDASRAAEAERHFRRAIALTPEDDTAYAFYGRWLKDHGRATEAIVALQKAIVLNPQRLFQREQLAQAYNRSADEFLNDSLHLNRAGEYDASSAAARNALRLNPQFAEAWNNIAANNEALHRWDDAVAAAQKAIALKPDFQLAKNNLAWALSQKSWEYVDASHHSKRFLSIRTHQRASTKIDGGGTTSAGRPSPVRNGFSGPTCISSVRLS